MQSAHRILAGLHSRGHLRVYRVPCGPALFQPPSGEMPRSSSSRGARGGRGRGQSRGGGRGGRGRSQSNKTLDCSNPVLLSASFRFSPPRRLISDNNLWWMVSCRSETLVVRSGPFGLYNYNQITQFFSYVGYLSSAYLCN